MILSSGSRSEATTVRKLFTVIEITTNCVHDFSPFFGGLKELQVVKDFLDDKLFANNDTSSLAQWEIDALAMKSELCEAKSKSQSLETMLNQSCSNEQD